MEKLGLNEIREKYLSFFESKGHLRLPSFSLVPQKDPSILLINAGMTPLKPYFIGTEVPPRKRVTTCQKCIRTPDIERVGYTSRHGTFFEMLGNFSFGDYFKAEAISWAWEFITEVLKLPEERLYITVYKDDDEAYDYWHQKIGVAENKIYRLGKEDNFWEHGTGPCGPCSEIHFDRGPNVGCGRPDCHVGCDCDRFVEFWNLVFSQFDRQEDGTYLPMVHKNIDTGGGLERFACIMQGVDNLFEVDTVRRILDAVCKIAKVHYGNDHMADVAIRVITDHIRSTTMMISDGVLPSNEGRGYVLRRLLRRAARYGRLLGIDGLFLHDLLPVVVQESCGAYPELKEREDYILRVIETEEKRFDKTVKQGSQLLDGYINEAKKAGSGELSGDVVFKLHDTYGFPLDLTREIAAEQGISVDEAGFKKNMQRQKDEARAALKAKGGSAWAAGCLPAEVEHKNPTQFVGYSEFSAKGKLLYIISSDEAGEPILLPMAGVDADVILITDRTPFYATGGGQVGDIGTITGEHGLKVEVKDTTKTAEGIFLHHCHVIAGSLEPGMELDLAVNRPVRMDIMRNHSATHLLHKALRTVLGTHVTQAGSLVNAEHLRFDFHHMKPCTAEELRQIEAEVNRAILANYQSVTEVMPMAEAKKKGAMALFDEKYGDMVRVVSMGDYSVEFCGGTHLSETSQVGIFHIVSEGSVASGIRRIEAITGSAALRWLQDLQKTTAEAADMLKIKVADLPERIAQLQNDLKSETKKFQALQSELAKAQAAELKNKAREAAGINYLAAAVSVDGVDDLRAMAESLRSQLAPAAVVLGAEIKGKLNFVAMASPEAVKKGVKAGNLVKAAASISGGGGGGRPDMAQAGGKDVAKLPEALAAVEQEIINYLS